ncbi:mtk1/mekk4 [Anaeramoeba ignava]|uniref:non-specific serine/threonine protein kinase n=1 Tax=Anaeramoeba ignava TaxID=1746090 RepID=A0A9Q0LWX1_ANAIG|nr:mtk1/mekk4 [Anaeramoeba ignava]
MSKKNKKNRGTYQIGDEIGRGQFGIVYKGMNTETGNFVAIKQIALSRIPKNELKTAMREIELLQKLHNKYIIKYLGFTKTTEHLNIILEYVENGSLYTIMKKFGTFSENVTKRYIYQTLKGLVYLHKQGVIHRDIKCANILVTTDGGIKLTDFGVATQLSEKTMQQSFLGSPYWMAPEVIELSPPTTKCDIWSVGCTIIELLTGEPPYFQFSPTHALYRIIQDDSVPIPDGISPQLQDFLNLCFVKNPDLRISSKKLLQHSWLKNIKTPHDKKKHHHHHHHSHKKNKKGKDKDDEKISKYSQESTVKSNESKDDAKESDSIIESFSESESDLSFKSDKSETNLEKFKSNESLSQNSNQSSKEILNQNSKQNDIFSKFEKFKEDDEDFEDLFKKNQKIPDKPNLKIQNIKQLELDEQLAKQGIQQNFQNLNISANQNAIWDPVSTTGRRYIPPNINSNPEMFIGKDKFKQFVEDPDENFDNSFFNLEEKLLNNFQKRKFSEVNRELILDTDEDKADIQKSNARKKNLRTSEEIVKLISTLQKEVDENILINTCQQLYNIFDQDSNSTGFLITYHGVTPIMEMLELGNLKILPIILKIVNKIIEGNSQIQENLCLIGGIPTIMVFATPNYSREIREEVSSFIYKMCHTSPMTLQMFIACRGLPILSHLLSSDYQENKKIIFEVIQSIDSVFKLITSTPKNDFCRLFAKTNLFPSLACVLKDINNDSDLNSKKYLLTAANLFQTFTNADTIVKRTLSSKDVLEPIFQNIRKFPENVQIKILHGIKNISMNTETWDNIKKSGAVPILIPFLNSTTTEIYSQALSTLFYLCKIDQETQQEAALQGIIPILQKMIRASSVLKEFAIPMLFGIGHATALSRNELIRSDGVNFFLDLLANPNYQNESLALIATLISKDREKVEPILIQPQNIQKIISIFDNQINRILKSTLESLLTIIISSEKINEIIGSSSLVEKIIAKLLDHSKIYKIQVKIKALKVLDSLFQNSCDQKQMIQKYNLVDLISTLSKKENEQAVIFHELLNQFKNSLKEFSQKKKN